MNRQHFEVAKIFRESDPRTVVGWVLIVMRGILICDIRLSSKTRNPAKIRSFRIGSKTLKFTELAGFPDGRAMLKVP